MEESQILPKIVIRSSISKLSKLCGHEFGAQKKSKTNVRKLGDGREQVAAVIRQTLNG
jgi:hypothetical protein